MPATLPQFKESLRAEAARLVDGRPWRSVTVTVLEEDGSTVTERTFPLSAAETDTTVDTPAMASRGAS